MAISKCFPQIFYHLTWITGTMRFVVDAEGNREKCGERGRGTMVGRVTRQ